MERATAGSAAAPAASSCLASPWEACSAAAGCSLHMQAAALARHRLQVGQAAERILATQSVGNAPKLEQPDSAGVDGSHWVHAAGAGGLAGTASVCQQLDLEFAVARRAGLTTGSWRHQQTQTVSGALLQAA